MIDVVPGIFEKDWEKLEQKVKLVAPYVEWVQIDFADGTMIPATSCMDFERLGDLIKSFSDNGRKLSFEAHLLVNTPEKYIKQLVDAGFRRIIAHIEANDPRLFLDQAQYESVETGLAIDGPTELEQFEPFLGEIDTALILLNEAGADGAEPSPEALEKVRAVRESHPDLPIEADEGVTELSAKVVVDAGATRIVPTSFIFRKTDPSWVAEAIEKLKAG